MRGNGLEARYLQYYFRSQEFRELLCADVTGVGGSLTRAQPRRIAEFQIPLAPFNEQQRIADKLDALFDRLDLCQVHFDRIPGLILALRKSILSAATSEGLSSVGDLAEAEQHRNWKVYEFDDLLADKSSLSYGVLKPGDDDPDGVPMFRVVDIGEWGKKNDTKPTMISKRLSNEFRRTVLRPGDVLLSVMATIGRAMVATEEMSGANVNRAIAVVKPDGSKVDSYFLLLHLLSPRVVREFAERSIGSAQVRINLGDLRKFKVVLPPLEQQKAIVRRVKSLFDYLDGVEARYQAAADALGNITSAMLAKAFRGELVPHDPNDEPASALLDRIREDRLKLLAARPREDRARRKEVTQIRASDTIQIKGTATAMVRKSPISRKNRLVLNMPYLRDCLLQNGGQLSAQALYESAGLDLPDYYKQLADEFGKGLLKDAGDGLVEVA